MKSEGTAKVTIRPSEGKSKSTGSSTGSMLIWNKDFQFPICPTYQIKVEGKKSGKIILTPSAVSFAAARDHDYPVPSGILTLRHGSLVYTSVRSPVQVERPEEMEVQILRQETTEINRDSQSSLDRTLRMVAEMREMGANSLHALHDQGQEIEHMRDQVATIERDTRRSDRKLRSIESTWGTLANKVLPGARVATVHTVHTETPIEHRETTRTRPTGVLFPQEDRTHEEEVLEEQTNQLWAVLDDLKAIALHMNQEVTDQLHNTDALNREIIHADGRMRKTGARVKKLC